ncbi:MAG: flagellar basal body rod protein FlgC [Planctomycetota bacterium]
MNIENIHTPTAIAVSSMKANALRMKVIANNIANANCTSKNGQPYRRRDVVTSSRNDELTGISLADVVDDKSSQFRPVYEPGHPHANEEGYVLYPNVEVPKELTQMMLASRHYQASVAIMKQNQTVSQSALELLK